MYNNKCNFTVGTNLPATQTITGGGLPVTYVAVQFHFHWAMEDTKGSEHVVDGESYPLEVMVVLSIVKRKHRQIIFN